LTITKLIAALGNTFKTSDLSKKMGADAMMNVNKLAKATYHNDAVSRAIAEASRVKPLGFSVSKAHGKY
jgi:hypothetical protein